MVIGILLSLNICFLVLRKYSFYSESMSSTKQKVHVGSQYSKTCLKQPLKTDKTKILIIIGSLMKVEILLTCIKPCIKRQLIFFFEWPLKTGFTV